VPTVKLRKALQSALYASVCELSKRLKTSSKQFHDAMFPIASFCL